MPFEFIDIHHHIIYGVDDGPPNCIDMFNMIKAAYEDGVRTIIATPHIAPGIRPFKMQELESKVNEARSYCDTNKYDMDIYLGSEILYNNYAERLLLERAVPTMAGSNKILLEFYNNIGFDDLERAIQITLRCGLVPILAHVERYNKIIFASKKLCLLKEKYQPLFQIDVDCILNQRKYVTFRVIKNLLSQGAIDFIASDAHDVEKRKCNMTAAYLKLANMYSESFADHLMCNHCTINDFIRA